MKTKEQTIRIFGRNNNISMDLQAEIDWIRAELMNVKDPELISAFKSLLKYRKKQIKVDWWNEISASEKAEIEEGVKQIENGDFIRHDEVMASPRKWS